MPAGSWAPRVATPSDAPAAVLRGHDESGHTRRTFLRAVLALSATGVVVAAGGEQASATPQSFWLTEGRELPPIWTQDLRNAYTASVPAVVHIETTERTRLRLVFNETLVMFGETLGMIAGDGRGPDLIEYEVVSPGVREAVIPPHSGVLLLSPRPTGYALADADETSLSEIAVATVGQFAIVSTYEPISLQPPVNTDLSCSWKTIILKSGTYSVPHTIEITAGTESPVPTGSIVEIAIDKRTVRATELIGAVDGFGTALFNIEFVEDVTRDPEMLITRMTLPEIPAGSSLTATLMNLPQDHALIPHRRAEVHFQSASAELQSEGELALFGGESQGFFQEGDSIELQG